MLSVNGFGGRYCKGERNGVIKSDKIINNLINLNAFLKNENKLV